MVDLSTFLKTVKIRKHIAAPAPTIPRVNDKASVKRYINLKQWNSLFLDCSSHMSRGHNYHGIWYARRLTRGVFKPIFAWVSLFFLLTSCVHDDYSPKPRGFYKIELPEKAYQQTQTGCPYQFEIPTYSLLLDDKSSNAQPCWKNIDFPQFNARLHLSYFTISENASFDMLTEDARTFVFKHVAKATAIDQQQISNHDRKIYGLRYEIGGNTASNVQFYLSDSIKHYLRGALYFNEKPNLDSIKPVLEFIKEDIDHMINTVQWK